MLASLQTDLPQTEKRTATIKVSGSGGGSRNMLSKTTEYALRSVVYVAMHHDAKRVGLKEIARELELPEPFIGKILQNLVRQGVLRLEPFLTDRSSGLRENVEARLYGQPERV